MCVLLLLFGLACLISHLSGLFLSLFCGWIYRPAFVKTAKVKDFEEKIGPEEPKRKEENNERIHTGMRRNMWMYFVCVRVCFFCQKTFSHTPVMDEKQHFRSYQKNKNHLFSLLPPPIPFIFFLSFFRITTSANKSTYCKTPFSYHLWLTFVSVMLLIKSFLSSKQFTNCCFDSATTGTHGQQHKTTKPTSQQDSFWFPSLFLFNQFSSSNLNKFSRYFRSTETLWRAIEYALKTCVHSYSPSLPTL